MDDTSVPEPPPPPPELEDSIRVATRPEAAGRGGLPLAELRALLRNRFILGGLGVLAVLFLVMIVLVAFGNGDGGPRRGLSIGEDGTPGNEPTAAPRSGFIGNVRATTTMRNGPGPTYAILGTIRRGALISIIGRNADDTWLQVIHPPGSQIRGWVDASFIETSGDLSELAVAGPGSGPDVDVPTYDVPWVPPPTVPPPTRTPSSSTTTPPSSPSPPTETPPAASTATPPPPPTEAPQPTPTEQRTPASQSLATETPAAPATQQPTRELQAPPTETPAT